MAKIHIARNGKIIGEHDEHAVTALVALRQILPTDHWWKKGMTRWLPIGSTFNPPETRRPKPDNHLRYTCERCGTRFNEPVEQKSGSVLTELFYWICSPIAGGFIPQDGRSQPKNTALIATLSSYVTSPGKQYHVLTDCTGEG